MGPAPTDEALAARIRAGDAEAFGLLFERHAAPVQQRVAQLMPEALRRKVSVSDVMQEARVVAYERFPDFEHRGEGSFRNWLRVIAENRVRAAVQHAGAAKRAVRREVSRGQRPDTAAFQGNGPSPSEAAAGRELADLARQAMATLSADHREILRLATEEQLPLREAAERMGRSREAVKKLYGRALANFTRAFERLTGGSHG